MGGAMSVVIKGSSNVNLDFTTGGRITGDFSNATHANRVMFQSSTTNGNTVVGAIPNGTASAGQYAVYSAQDPTNASQGQFLIDSSAGLMSIRSSVLGTGTYLPMTFYTGGSERVRVDTSGNVGIGTSSPTNRLSLKQSADNSAAGLGVKVERSANDSVLFLGYRDNSDSWQINATFNSTGAFKPLTFHTADAERMRIDSSGNVGIGTSSPGVKLQVAGSGRFTGFDTGYYNENVLALGNASFNPKLGMASNNGYRWNTRIKDVGGNGEYVIRYEEGSLDALTIDRSGNLGLGVTPSAWDTTIFRTLQVGTGAGSVSLSGRTDSAKDMVLGSNLYYATGNFRYVGTGAATVYRMDGGTHAWFIAPSGTAGNAISFSQVMTLEASGNLLVGTTANSDGNRLNIRQSAAGAGAGIGAGTGGGLLNWYNNAGGYLASVTHSGATVTYGTGSDYRLKNITGPITTSGAYIDSLNPVEGTWKADGSTFVGLIAHEVQEASRTPVATGTKDGEQMQGMDYSSPEIIANLIAEVKSLRARVAQLEAK
jgi:hypothetical protein